MTARKVEKIAYRTAEAAAATGLSRDTILRAVHAGKLDAKKVGTGPRAAYLITADALQRWIDSLNDAA
jgi:excisionase family DNA binding protein